MLFEVLEGRCQGEQSCHILVAESHLAPAGVAAGLCQGVRYDIFYFSLLYFL